MRRTVVVFLLALITLSTARASASEPDGRRTKMKSVPLLVTGIVLGVLGTGSIVAGGVIYSNAVQEERACQRTLAQVDPSVAGFGLSCAGTGIGKMAALPMIIGGSAFVLAGAPMTIVGGWPVPDRTAVPEVRVGPKSAALRWRF